MDFQVVSFKMRLQKHFCTTVFWFWTLPVSLAPPLRSCWFSTCFWPRGQFHRRFRKQTCESLPWNLNALQRYLLCIMLNYFIKSRYDLNATRYFFYTFEDICTYVLYICWNGKRNSELILSHSVVVVNLMQFRYRWSALTA